jgi:hypothetical protein
VTVASSDASSALNGSQEVPEGYQWVLVPENRPEGARLVRTLAWRVYEDEEVLLDALAETFRSKRHSDALRWVLEQPEVRKVMFERIRGAK